MFFPFQMLSPQRVIWFDLCFLVWLCIRFFLMEPAPQLQPVNPKPQLDFAEPAARRPLELRPGPRPLDLRPRPRPQLDVKFGPQTPAEAARARATSANPFTVAQPVLNNPLGFAPGKGLAQIATGILGRAEELDRELSTPEELSPEPLPELARPDAFPVDAIPGGQTEPLNLPDNDPTVGGSTLITGVAIQFTRSTPRADTAPISFTVTVAGKALAPEVVIGPARPPGHRTVASFIGYTVQVLGAVVFSNGNDTSTASISSAIWTPPQGYQPPQPQVRPNPARRPSGFPIPVFPSPASRDQPFRPIPIPSFALPDLRTGPGFFVPPEPLPVPDPPIAPVRKFPPLPEVPQLPGQNPTTDRSPTRFPPPVTFPPTLPGTTGDEINPPPRRPLPPVFVPPLRRDDCCADRIVLQESRKIQDGIDEILQRILEDCKDLCGPALMTRTVCADVGGEIQPVSEFDTILTMAEALELLSAELASVKRLLNPCPPPEVGNVPPVLLASGSMTDAETIAYVAVGPDVRQVELIVVGQIPTSVRLYDTTQSGEQQGKFGSICVSYPGVTGGRAPDAFHQWAWTRRTSLYIDRPVRPGREIRIYLRAGLQWVLYDTGVRN